jgi:hypothetical protein
MAVKKKFKKKKKKEKKHCPAFFPKAHDLMPLYNHQGLHGLRTRVSLQRWNTRPRKVRHAPSLSLAN